MSNTVERLSVQERLRRGEESPNVDTLFYFMYSNYSPSPNSLNRGLLRSPMLIKVSSVIKFWLPSSHGLPVGIQSRLFGT